MGLIRGWWQEAHFSAALAALLGLAASPGLAQHAPVLVGAWETCQAPSSGDTEYVRHLFLEFSENGEYRRVVLADDPARPFSEETGTYEASETAITLRFLGEVGGVIAAQSAVVPFRVSAAADTLYWGTDPSTALQRGRELSAAVYGVWGIINPFDGQVAGRISLRPDGTYEADLGGGREKGWFVVAGSGMVHWATQADNPDLVGVPAVWTRVRVDGDQLSYDIACSFTITAVRLASTAVRAASWAEIKRAFR